jgi:hypothetical protein
MLVCFVTSSSRLCNGEDFFEISNPVIVQAPSNCPDERGREVHPKSFISNFKTIHFDHFTHFVDFRFEAWRYFVGRPGCGVHLMHSLENFVGGIGRTANHCGTCGPAHLLPRVLFFLQIIQISPFAHLESSDKLISVDEYRQENHPRFK